MKNNVLRTALALILLAACLLSLASCTEREYSRLGISFKIPSSFKEKAVAGAKMAFGDDEAFIVFNKFDKAMLGGLGLSPDDVKGYTDYFLEKSELLCEPVYNASLTGASFSYVVEDPEDLQTYYYYYVVILKGTDCIWAVQMACYDALAYEYIPKFKSWEASLRTE